jgi:hypothetical protein
MQYVWFIWSLIIFTLWAIIYLSKKDFGKEILKMSCITMLFGLTEPLFVPEYTKSRTSGQPRLHGTDRPTRD